MAVTVIKGDTLGKIAKSLGITTTELLKLNPQISNPDLIYPGDVINTPGDSGGVASGEVYTVVKGDTLGRIATANGLTLSQLLDLNPQYKSNPDLVLIGAKINLGGGSTPSDTSPPPEPVEPVEPSIPDITPIPDPLPSPPIPDPPVSDPNPTPDSLPDPEPVDFRAQVQALYPFLPSALLDLYAEAWADTGDPSLALAEVRSSPQYNTFFPGLKRADGSLRMTESEYLSRLDGYRLALGQFNLNPSNFESKFVEMIEGELTVNEFANRLQSAYEQVVTQMPEVKAFYQETYGLSLTDEAVFASFIDPDIGDAILNRRIAVSQIGGAGAAQGFGVDLAYADSLRQRGVSFGQAQQFFADAAFNIPTLNTLAGRYGVDRNVDLGEFTQAQIFGDPFQRRRFSRLKAAESSRFTDQLGTVATSEDLSLRGLSVR